MEIAKFTYGVVSKVSLEEYKELREFIEERNIQIIFDKISPSKIYLVETNPSGNIYNEKQ